MAGHRPILSGGNANRPAMQLPTARRAAGSGAPQGLIPSQRLSAEVLEEPAVNTKRILLTILAIATFLLLLAAVTAGAQ